ncbi:hypothetical protein [Methylocella silvestris]|uniref:Uncharacterized protein n=1 Tax=Methylocella silvestris TaxID=199596 RepID=A0A2J7TFG8_METSI|nr:hypothetical protein [Methylocella silvestris]PNG25515.1 hypothetical protein CR492_13450 [Methylocella silvestris]
MGDISLAQYAPSGAVPSYSLVDFTAVGGRQERQIEIEMITATSFYGAWVGPTETIWAPPSSDNLRWIQNGDSLTQSAGNLPGGLGDGYGEIMADCLGISDYRAAGIGAPVITPTTAASITECRNICLTCSTTTRM